MIDPKTLGRLDATLAKMQRRLDRPRRRFPLSPLTLGLGLALGVVLLTELLPRLYENLLPGGLRQAQTLRGWPGLVWQSAVLCYDNRPAAGLGIAGVAAVAFVLAGRSRLLGFLCWLAAFGVIVLDASILATALQVSLRATSAAAGLDLGF